MAFNNYLQFMKYQIVEAVMSGNDEELLDLINKLLITEGGAPTC